MQSMQSSRPQRMAAQGGRSCLGLGEQVKCEHAAGQGQPGACRALQRGQQDTHLVLQRTSPVLSALCRSPRGISSVTMHTCTAACLAHNVGSLPRHARKHRWEGGGQRAQQDSMPSMARRW